MIAIIWFNNNWIQPQATDKRLDLSASLRKGVRIWKQAKIHKKILKWNCLVVNWEDLKGEISWKVLRPLNTHGCGWRCSFRTKHWIGAIRRGHYWTVQDWQIMMKTALHTVSLLICLKYRRPSNIAKEHFEFGYFWAVLKIVQTQFTIATEQKITKMKQHRFSGLILKLLKLISLTNAEQPLSFKLENISPS